MLFRTWEDLIKNTEIEKDDSLFDEVTNPDGETFDYSKTEEGLFTYQDSKQNLYFARITYQPTSDPYFEFKVGWFEDNDASKPKYEPQLPPDSTSLDNMKRRNTVSKIYRDEILPLVKRNLILSRKLIIDPISQSRFIFSERLVQKYTPKDEFNIEIQGNKLILTVSES